MNQDYWLSGFADGEASFAILSIRYDGRKYYRPEFIINLRSDDSDILRQLQDTFGGSLYHEPPHTFNNPGNGKEYTGKPRSKWTVLSKIDLMKIVSYFDRFPLRAKKARDYKLWRVAVYIYVNWGRGDSRLPVLQQAIRDGREFDIESIPSPNLGPIQMEIQWENQEQQKN